MFIQLSFFFDSSSMWSKAHEFLKPGRIGWMDKDVNSIEKELNMHWSGTEKKEILNFLKVVKEYIIRAI